MSNRFDQRGWLVRHRFGEEKRVVVPVPGEVRTRTWRFAGGVASRAQSLADAHKFLDQYIEKLRKRLAQGVPQHGTN
jgi:hypothetical protein